MAEEVYTLYADKYETQIYKFDFVRGWAKISAFLKETKAEYASEK